MTTLMVFPGSCTTAGNLRWSVTFSLLAPKPCAPTGVADYARKAQLMAYDGERAMFEAYGRNKFNSVRH